MTNGDPALDQQNADFWDELCGTTMAIEVGATGRTPDDLRRFDSAYLGFYPYLLTYFPEDLHGKRVLEVGLGYGTLGAALIGRGADYTGVDIAPGPVAMMQHRIEIADRAAQCDARQASVLELPFGDAEFDVACSIGCLHHTGDLVRSVAELRRVLRPGGCAVVMLYNRWSARQIQHALRNRVRFKARDAEEQLRSMYDTDSAGNAAPHTDFVSVREARQLFSSFRSVHVQRRNVSVPHAPILRKLLLAVRVDRLLGLDLYIRAVA